MDSKGKKHEPKRLYPDTAEQEKVDEGKGEIHEDARIAIHITDVPNLTRAFNIRFTDRLLISGRMPGIM